MSESGDFDPGPWRSREHNFTEARKSYDRHVGRSYSEAVTSGRKPMNLIPKSLTSYCESPLVIACDDTYSMGDWPSVIFSKLPYLDIEGKEYLGQSREISFAAVGDAYIDKYPFQARPFCNGTDLKTRLKEFVVEQGGGPSYRESYDLAALYYARNVNMPNAINKPVFIFIADEGLYDLVDREQAKKWARTNIERRVSYRDVLNELKSKYSVYLIRKPYGLNRENGDAENRAIQAQWEECLGADHIAVLPDPNRVVDVIFGILAKEKEMVDYFKEEIEGRQITAEDRAEGIKKVEIAYSALSPVFGKKLTIDSKHLK